MSNEPPSNAPSSGIDEAIGKVEDLYRAVTGNPPPPGESTSAAIPVERDPTRFVEDQVDRLLSMLSSPADETAPAYAWSPPVSVWENEKEFVVSVDLAGVARSDVEVKLQGNRLTISGRRPAAFSSDHRLRASERPFGPFQRTVLLPPSARGGENVRVDARFRDGELEIRVTKEGTTAEGPRSVPVN